ncbi:hypothetical protein AC1031_015650 [Aphanomyces cochlioides]|nr:hypothetical protein AC1031_015650 [Aphanomyces cochlioides]
MSSSSTDWEARVRAAHAVYSRWRETRSTQDLELLSLGFISSLNRDQVVQMCEDGSLLMIVQDKTQDDVTYSRFAFAVVRQCLDVAKQQTAVMQTTLDTLINSACLPLLHDDCSASLGEIVLDVLLHALQAIPSEDSSWWDQLHARLLVEFTAPPQNPSWLGLVVEFLFKHKRVSSAFVDKITSICASMVTSSDSLRQAIFGAVVPQLIQYDSTQAQVLFDIVLKTWKVNALQHVCLMLCELLPHCPLVHRESAFHSIVRLGLQQDEAVVRKMALHLLSLSLAREPKAHPSWSSFVHAFEIVHFHHEQHLMEQVWPSIATLVKDTIVVPQASQPLDYSLFDLPLPFEWFQGIMQRCWHHDNPVVRRMTLTEFMVVGDAAWKDHPEIQPGTVRFVLDVLLPSLNDPFLFKHEKYNVRSATVAFTTRFVTLAVKANLITLVEYLDAVQAAIFGDQTRGNSPDALLALLSIFTDLPSSFSIAPEGLDVLRYMVQAHVLQSFPKTMKVLVPILERVLFVYTSAESLPLEAVARYLLLFPLEHLQQHRSAFANFLTQLHAPIYDGLALYFTEPAKAMGTAALTRLILCSTVDDIPWPATMTSHFVEVSQLFETLNSASLTTITAQLPATYFDHGLDILKKWFQEDQSGSDESLDTDSQLAVVYLLTQIALDAMQTLGDCEPAHRLNSELVLALNSLVQESSSSQQATLVVQTLDVIATEAPFLMDSISIFDPQVLVPQLLSFSLVKGNDKRDSTFARQFVKAKYSVLAAVLTSCWSLSPELLQRVLDEVVDALPTAGNDPLVLEHMVHVLRIVLPFTAGKDDDDSRLDDIFDQVWASYSDSRKPDSLTNAVIQCLFQPQLMSFTETLKRWFTKWTRFGEGGRRPNVMFHLATTLCGIWRQYPTRAIAFVDEIITLLLYKEPTVDVKEQMIYLSDGAALKERYVRFVVLAFLEDAPMACHPLMDALIVALLHLQLLPEFMKPQMINSDGFGRQLRSWQALCVLSKYAQAHNVDSIHEILWHRAFLNHNLPQIRYFIEIFAMRVALAFPISSFPYLQQLLKDMHMMPQLSASLLLVTSVVLRRLPVDETPQLHLDTLLLMVPWLNSTHGHTRTIVQFAVVTLLPYFITRSAYASTVAFLEPTLRYLTSNKDCKRMFRRQTDQMASFVPEKECSLAGLLGGTLNEFDEIVPVSIVEQVKEALSASFAQFLKEDRRHGGQYQSNVADSLKLSARSVEELPDIEATSNNASIVQRKIDPNAVVFLEQLLAQHEAESLREKQVNARRQRHQPVIVCASLVEKIPNVAGLARTCEIFNASKLLVPSMTMTEDVIFRQISVTANKWVDMEEVRPEDVRAYLRRIKLLGYTVVALEQTSSSACLSTFEFPDKCVIVLGNEKEGIPVDILQMVDLCVEIPQMGVIRSLNVHVSGAILLWSYTQQRLLRQQQQQQ